MRILLLTSLFLIGVGLIAGVLLVPSYIIVKKNRTSLEDGITALAASSTNVADMELLNHIRQRMDVLSPLVLSTRTPDEEIQSAIAAEPAGVIVDRITYDTSKGSTIVLSGSSISSERISEFQRALMATGRYSSVSVPVGAIAGVDNDRFNITLNTK